VAVLIAVAEPLYRVVMAWATFVIIALLILDSLMRWTTRVRLAWMKLTSHTPSVDADVRVLMADTVNVNADPTRPNERVAAVNEYRQHRQGR
jgi:hypothetical protein